MITIIMPLKDLTKEYSIIRKSFTEKYFEILSLRNLTKVKIIRLK